MENYRKVQKIGQGSFGRIYLIEHEKTKVKYVLKEVDLCDLGADGKTDDEAKQEALAEVYYLNKLHNHPNIVSIIECFESEKMKILYIVMEYANGGDMENFIKERSQTRRPFPEYQIIDWLVQICLAIKHIHDRKILHRDIKTPNIFLMEDNTVCKLGDFGIARSLAYTSDKAMTKIGTPFYMSPEICMEQAYNHKSDMWALGIVVYEMMCLRRPFDGADMIALSDSIVHRRHRPLPLIYRPELRALVDAMLEKDPRKRPSVNQVLQLRFLQKNIQRFLTRHEMEKEFKAQAPELPAPPNLLKGFHSAQSESPAAANARKLLHVPEEKVAEGSGEDSSSSSSDGSGTDSSEEPTSPSKKAPPLAINTDLTYLVRPQTSPSKKQTDSARRNYEGIATSPSRRKGSMSALDANYLQVEGTPEKKNKPTSAPLSREKSRKLGTPRDIHRRGSAKLRLNLNNVSHNSNNSNNSNNNSNNNTKKEAEMISNGKEHYKSVIESARRNSARSARSRAEAAAAVAAAENGSIVNNITNSSHVNSKLRNRQPDLYHPSAGLAHMQVSNPHHINPLSPYLHPHMSPRSFGSPGMALRMAKFGPGQVSPQVQMAQLAHVHQMQQLQQAQQQALGKGNLPEGRIPQLPFQVPPPPANYILHPGAEYSDPATSQNSGKCAKLKLTPRKKANPQVFDFLHGGNPPGTPGSKKKRPPSGKLVPLGPSDNFPGASKEPSFPRGRENLLQAQVHAQALAEREMMASHMARLAAAQNGPMNAPSPYGMGMDGMIGGGAEDFITAFAMQHHQAHQQEVEQMEDQFGVVHMPQEIIEAQEALMQQCIMEREKLVMLQALDREELERRQSQRQLMFEKAKQEQLRAAALERQEEEQKLAEIERQDYERRDKQRQTTLQERNRLQEAELKLKAESGDGSAEDSDSSSCSSCSSSSSASGNEQLETDEAPAHQSVNENEH